MANFSAIYQDCNTSKSGEYYANHESLTFQVNPTPHKYQSSSYMLMINELVINCNNSRLLCLTFITV